MLKKLSVSNFALIEDIDLTFKPGFTVITGETGAGKSILIDAISYVLGTKFNKEFIRTGKDTTFVKATFDRPSSLKNVIQDEEIVIERENNINGKTQAKINGKIATVNEVKSLAVNLLDIHGQHNNQNLLNPETHIDYLDAYGDIKNFNEYKKYRKLYIELKEKESKLFSLTKGNEREKLIDYLKFQIDEIKKAKISVEEEEELIEKSNMLSHSQKIGEALNTSTEVFSNEEYNVISSLKLALKNLNSIEDVLPKVKDKIKLIEESYYILEEVSRDLEDLKSNVYFNQNELDEVNGRLFIYHDIKKKYGEEVKDVLAYLQEKEDELFELENRSEIIEKLKLEISKIKKDLLESGLVLHKERERISELLSSKINKELKEVGLNKADFKPFIEEGKTFYENGIDNVMFLISTNTGEPRKALEKIVSGGELSRIMLALKSAFIDKDKIPTVIFDEIDTGISGPIAQSVGKKMYNISNKCQVLCVTHLPQIASYSDNHYIASKEEKNKRTFSKIVEATKDEKVKEIAKMLGGVELTESAIENAKDLIEIVKKD